jgi:DNA-binding transcriptional LysR family regulator
MKKELDRMRDMALFAHVAALGSLTRAAESTGVPASTLSRRISEFESQIGVKLLHRSTRRLALTDIGQRYLDRITDVVDRARAISGELEDEMVRPTGPLRVCAPVDFSAYFPEAALADYCASHPGVRVELHCSADLPDLATEPYDLCIATLEPPRASRMVRRRIGMAEYQCYASPAYLRAFGEPAHPADLARHRCIVMPGTASGLSLSNGTATAHVDIAPLLVLNHQLAMENLLRDGLGIGPLTRGRADRLVRDGALLPVLDGWALPPRPILALTASRALPARVRGFIDLLAAQVVT